MIMKWNGSFTGWTRLSATVSINGEERRYDRLIEQWISQRLKELRSQSVPICVKVSVTGDGVNLGLSSGGCSGGTGGGGRAPNLQEADILSKWEQRGLREVELNPGKLIAFLHQLKP